ncbi:hypothetical protein C7974DRAFT_77084 [Boeremia exigua]|uniref:uncharacterized protein n=1 Tax=Boeremia exigua TaxID=749465 RepID=UPI001E8EC2C2|nr:uncharacterized protein C7974DRAFT_77084 [Boeremia exigua]KAH6613215.1 hypothetical protein C7974DRAFT_77084 [Boeremia exigua]
MAKKTKQRKQARQDAERTSMINQDSNSEGQPQRPLTSPYAEVPVELIVGPEKIVYYVSRYAVPSAWSKASPENRYYLPDVDRETGHTLVHYLYKGAYETLEVIANASLSGACAEFAQALLVYMMSSKYSGLKELQRLAILKMEDIGQRLDICEVLGAIKSQFTKLQSDSWVHDYVFKKAKTAFAEDRTVFKSNNLAESTDNAYEGFLMRCIIDSYDERIFHMAETERVLLEKLDNHALASPDKLVKNTLSEEKAEGLEDFILPDVDDVDVKESRDQDEHEQYSISTGDFSTIECSSSDSAASASTESVSIEEAIVEEAIVEERHIRQPCPRQAAHMLEEKRWKNCKSCRAVLHKVAIRLAQAS